MLVSCSPWQFTNGISFFNSIDYRIITILYVIHINCQFIGYLACLSTEKDSCETIPIQLAKQNACILPQTTLATFMKWSNDSVDIIRSSGSVCHQDPRWDSPSQMTCSSLRRRSTTSNLWQKTNMLPSKSLKRLPFRTGCARSRPLQGHTYGPTTSPSGR